MLTKEVAPGVRSSLAGFVRRRRQAEPCCAVVQMPLPPPVEEQARQRLAEHCPYAFYFRQITFQFQSGVLTLRGSVPTFYLKQMLQTWLRGLNSVQHIDNQVDVVSATGLSSEPRTEPPAERR